MTTPLLEVRNIAKSFGRVKALQDVSCAVRSGEVTAVLGDNGAGKSTFIKTLSGVHPPDTGEYLVDGEAVHFTSPRDARARGIATVYQDLAVAPLMPIWRNFFLGSEPASRGFLKSKEAKAIVHDELRKMGIQVRDPEQPIGTMSGGERQSVAIARAVYFGARVLILDEPTSALGVRQAGVVLRYIVQAKERGLGVIFITHNPNHAYPVSDHFVLLQRGRTIGDHAKSEITMPELARQMAGGAELEALQHELHTVLKDDQERTTATAS
ncbi:ATP-binding cassette domain-containing protein [Nakamurella sp. YIM 132087]|uniref:ATP-binding cassette domain-containing protein n=1 Tax=Nakamurella alba TaxID=2665158 RepID=A0A7K1FS43_9ACTN|nr:ATP-binding cassette domain-containing protein [Nakamurella alba]MTD16890.1 ATP-binding cassette domain-containing protein [Nakamurella alba]